MRNRAQVKKANNRLFCANVVFNTTKLTEKNKKYSTLGYKWVFGKYSCLSNQTSPKFQCSRCIRLTLVLVNALFNLKA